MKKATFILSALFICIALSACGKPVFYETLPPQTAASETALATPQATGTMEESTEPPIETVTPQPTPAPSLTPKPTPTPKALSLPKTSVMKNTAKGSRVAPLTIATQAGSCNGYFIKFVSNTTKKAAYEFFVRSGETLKCKVALGTYLMRYATGDTWYGTKLCFGEDTQYS